MLKQSLMTRIALKALLAFVTVADTRGPHCNFESKMMPSTFIWFLVSMFTLPIVIVVFGISYLKIKQISVLASLTVRPHL